MPSRPVLRCEFVKTFVSTSTNCQRQTLYQIERDDGSSGPGIAPTVTAPKSLRYVPQDDNLYIVAEFKRMPSLMQCDIAS